MMPTSKFNIFHLSPHRNFRLPHEQRKEKNEQQICAKPLWMWAGQKLTKKQTIRACYYWCVTTNSKQISLQIINNEKCFVCTIDVPCNRVGFIVCCDHNDFRYNFYTWRYCRTWHGRIIAFNNSKNNNNNAQFQHRAFIICSSFNLLQYCQNVFRWVCEKRKL